MTYINNFWRIIVLVKRILIFTNNTFFFFFTNLLYRDASIQAFRWNAYPDKLNENPGYNPVN